ncbi:MAG: hypothetical protein HYY03_02280 [Chloroflexi bacterium]|nr:hypothetical protein [Chloroflexota bacterium]
MRKKILAFVFASALLASSLGFLFGAGAASADAGGCPNAASANGAAHANGNSAHGAAKQLDRGC